MKCERCGKKEATVKYYENINGEKRELHLCSNCANSIGITDFGSVFSPLFLSIPDYLFEKEKIYCDTCGYKFDDYANTGFLGCPDCYDTFSDKLDDILYKLHGKTRHIKLLDKNNKVNTNRGYRENKKNSNRKHTKEEEIKKLKQEIQDLIKQEKYEQAAVVRDKIKKLENKKD